MDPAPATAVTRTAPGRTTILARPEATRYRLALVGGFRLTDEVRTLVVPTVTQRLVARLALHGPTGRSRLSGLLRPDASEERATASLRTALWRTRQLAPGLLEVVGETICLADRVDVDVARVLRVIHRVLAGEVEPGDLEVLVEEGELLPDWDDEWLAPDRERMRQLRLHVLEALAAHLTSTTAYGAAMDAALAALRTDPLRESAHRAVIRVHAAEGNLVAARRAFDDCAAVLARELGIAPSASTYAAAHDVAAPA